MSAEAVTDSTAAQLRTIGSLVRNARMHLGITQAQLAERLGTSQSAVVRMEQGQQNLSVDMLNRISAALGSDIIAINAPSRTNLKVKGGVQLSGHIAVRSSKNAGVALLCASLLNRGTTTLKNVARIDEVKRIVEVLDSIGMSCHWERGGRDLVLKRPDVLDTTTLDEAAARRTRSIIMFMGPLLHEGTDFELPYAGGCELGTRTVEPHMVALRPFGLQVVATEGSYHATVADVAPPTKTIVLTERGDTVTENAIMAAAGFEGVTKIRNASGNYMVQDLCFYLQDLGVEIEGVGTTNLTIRGKSDLCADVTYAPAEDPIEAMSLLTAAIVTRSQITVERAPIEFLEVELAVLAEMGLRYDLSDEYMSENGRTPLVDITVYPSDLKAPIDKIHPMPFPGLNIDNLPFFAVIAACATGTTLVHDWVYENRAIYLTELTRLGASVNLADPHRVFVNGPTHWSGAEVICPPALRPAVVVLLAMLAAKGTSVLRNVDIIHRGYEDLAERLVELGASIEISKSHD